HYLRNVLRLKPSDPVLVFNGREGEWRATLGDAGKRAVSLAIRERTRSQTPALDLHYLFAPIKHARIDYMMQKAVELGASRLQPSPPGMRRAARVKRDRRRGNAMEAAGKCAFLTLREIPPGVTLDQMTAPGAPGGLLIFCDEDAGVGDPFGALMRPRTADGH